MKKILFITPVLIIMFHLNAVCQTATPAVTKKQVRQQVRIAQGRQSGELTPKEAQALKMQQRHIRRTKKRAKSDGSVSKRERMEIRRKQRRANRNVHRLKHNNRSKN